MYLKKINNFNEFYVKILYDIYSECTNNPPTYKEHYNWFYKTSREIYLIIYKFIPIGYITIKNILNEISIGFYKKYRNKGFGTKSIKLLPVGNYTAGIKKNNFASQNLFKKFTTIESKQNVKIFEITKIIKEVFNKKELS